MIYLDEIITLEGKRNISKTGFDFSGKERFAGVSIDSRNIRKDEIFFAIKGEKTDGHNYLQEVARKKVKLAVINDSWLKSNIKSLWKNNRYLKNLSCLAVKDTIKTLGELASQHRQRNSVPVLCVGGSNGKTTVKDMIAAVLSNKFSVLKNDGNFNNHIGLPLTLLKLNENHSFAVLEAGSNHFNELKYLCEIAMPDCTLVTNIGKEHLEFFKNLKGVAKEEFELYEHINKNTDGVCLYNLDDKFIRHYYKKYLSVRKNLPSFTYSYDFDSDVKGKMLGYGKNFEPVFEVKYGKLKFKTFVNTFGKHSFYNGLAAAATGLFFGVPEKQIKEVLENFKPVSDKRMEVIEFNGIKIINDTYNSNPDSVKIGLETLKEYNTNGKKHVILADMLELGKESRSEHAAIGKLTAKMGFDFLYTYGGDSYNTFLSAKRMKNNYWFDNREVLSEFLKNTCSKGDIIYVKGSRGMEMEEVVRKIINEEYKIK
jgi:UDP-N-acetylmuramoyl-tripeptide--D-alanyl-D-alanine ligase